jgi:phosphatidylethanolamine/phosphatidyl-N-methylethanolamine N-methyltransferase
MKNRDEFRQRLYENYDSESSSGVFGFILGRGHKLLEGKFATKGQGIKILEFGGGRNPHFTWINNKEDIHEYHIVDFFDSALVSDLDMRFRLHTPELFYSDRRFIGYFDRIVACHVLEHINNPYEILSNWLALLKPGGTISLLLPNDPGLLWGSARWFYKHKLRLKGWKNTREYDLAVSLEHVNSIQNLLRITRYLERDCELEIKMWPFRFRISELNMQSVIHISKRCVDPAN